MYEAYKFEVFIVGCPMKEQGVNRSVRGLLIPVSTSFPC